MKSLNVHTNVSWDWITYLQRASYLASHVYAVNENKAVKAKVLLIDQSEQMQPLWAQ